MNITKGLVKEVVYSQRMLIAGLFMSSIYGLYSRVKGNSMDISGVTNFAVETGYVASCFLGFCVLIVSLIIFKRMVFNQVKN